MTDPESNTSHRAGEDTRYVFATLVRCPVCRSDAYKVYGRQPRAEAKTSYAKCRECEHKFLIVFEDSFNVVE